MTLARVHCRIGHLDDHRIAYLPYVYESKMGYFSHINITIYDAVNNIPKQSQLWRRKIPLAIPVLIDDILKCLCKATPNLFVKGQRHWPNKVL